MAEQVGQGQPPSSGTVRSTAFLPQQTPVLTNQQIMLQNQRILQEPWKYSLIWTGHGPLLKLPPTPIVTTKTAPNEMITSEVERPIPYKFSNPLPLPLPPRKKLCNASGTLPLDAPSASGVKSSGNAGKKDSKSNASVALKPMPRQRLPQARVTDEKIVALITIDQDFLQDIRTGAYPHEYVLCDLVHPEQAEDSRSTGIGSCQSNRMLNELEDKKPIVGIDSSVSIRDPVTISGTTDGNNFVYHQKMEVQDEMDMDRVKLTKLPCCTELAQEMTCISTLNLPSRAASCRQEGQPADKRLQQVLRGHFDDFDEIPKQLDAFCFTKTEIITSSATLASINTSKDCHMTGDLLRSHVTTRVKRQGRDDKIDSHVAGSKRSRAKTTKSTTTTQFSSVTSFVESSMVLEKTDVITSASSVKRKLFPAHCSDFAHNTQFMNETFPRPLPPKRQLAEIQLQPKAITPRTLNPKSSVCVQAGASTVAARKPKPRPRKYDSLPYPHEPVTVIIPSSFPPLKPKKKSPFDWLDDYFAKRRASPEKRKSSGSGKNKGSKSKKTSIAL